jgi:hypothetical protein
MRTLMAAAIAAAALLATSAAQAAGLTLNPCAAPTQIEGSNEQTAWRLLIAASCPVNQTEYPFVVWENWLDQAQMYPPDPAHGLHVPNALSRVNSATHQTHPSPLTLALHPELATVVHGLLGGADQNCNRAAVPPAGQPNLILCEEVRLNGAAEDYVAGTNIWRRAGQQQAATDHIDIQFPPDAVEIKVDWILLPSIGLDCNNLPAGFTNSIHVETIGGNCFGLVAIHLISKLLDNWIWATFEPQNDTTNPNRCRALGCTDLFGSRPAFTRGTPTRQSAALRELMAAANLAPEWSNMRLDGVQVGFQRPRLLGNSVTEGENAGVPLTQASCISCHAVSSVESDGTDGITLLTSNPVGFPKPLPSPEWIRRDFVWSLFLACPNSVAQQCSTGLGVATP